MDIVWIIHEPFVEGLRHCIARAEAHGAEQRLISMPDYSHENSGTFRNAIAPLLEAGFRERPAIIVWCLHVGNPQVHAFYRESPAKHNLVIEHDLFTDEPEGCVAMERSHEIPVFTRQHWINRLQFHAPNRVFTPARWYKLDAPLRPDARAFLASRGAASHDKWRYAILADSSLYAPGPFTAGGPFQAVYEKPWMQAVNREGTCAAPVDLHGPVGVVSAQHLAGFWISRKSSILAEAVFHGCIPVIHPQPEIPGEDCGRLFVKEQAHALYPQLSDVVIDKGSESNGRYLKLPAVTTTGDFEGKIRALQEDAALRESVLREIARHWMLTPYGHACNLPGVAEIALARLQELG